MSNNIKKRTDLLTPQLLKTPLGQKVTYEFLKSLSEGSSLEDALEKGKYIAQQNSSLLPFQISFIIDVLNVLGPVFIQFFSDYKTSKLQNWLFKIDIIDYSKLNIIALLKNTNSCLNCHYILYNLFYNISFFISQLIEFTRYNLQYNKIVLCYIISLSLKKQ